MNFFPVFAVDPGPNPPRLGRPGSSKDATPEFGHGLSVPIETSFISPQTEREVLTRKEAPAPTLRPSHSVKPAAAHTAKPELAWEFICNPVRFRGSHSEVKLEVVRCFIESIIPTWVKNFSNTNNEWA